MHLTIVILFAWDPQFLLKRFFRLLRKCTIQAESLYWLKVALAAQVFLYAIN